MFSKYQAGFFCILATTNISWYCVRTKVNLVNFCDVSKAFYRVWHEGVFFEIYCVKGNLLDFGFKSFFRQKEKYNVQKYTFFKCTPRVWPCPVTFFSCVNSKHVILNAILLMLHGCILSLFMVCIVFPKLHRISNSINYISVCS